MDIDKADRTTLRSFFRKNLVPTEDNFAELINGMLNQKDDGIARLPGDPLSIAAAGDSASPQKLIHFYGSFGDANPAWLLQMNPRADPNRPDTAKQGLSISDAQGTSRLFIDRATGNVGVGTISPTGRLEVNGLLRVTGSAQVLGRLGLGTTTPEVKLDIVADSTTAAGWLEAIRLSRRESSAITFPAGGLLFGMHGDRRFYFADTVGGRYDLLVVSAGDAKVGIGIKSPLHTLDVRGTSIKLGIEAGGGGQLIITSGSNDNKIRLEALNKDGNGHAAELLLTGHNSGNVPLLTLGADQTVASGNMMVRGTLTVGGEGNFTKLYAGQGLTVMDQATVNGSLTVTGHVRAKVVYFSAYLAANDLADNRPVLPMQVVSNNVGDGYSTATSKFTAPVSGVYLFTMTMLCEPQALLYWTLMVNDRPANSGDSSGVEPNERCLLTGHTADTRLHTSRTVIVPLRQGDRVHVAQQGRGKCDNIRSGLEGFLLCATT